MLGSYATCSWGDIFEQAQRARSCLLGFGNLDTPCRSLHAVRLCEAIYSKRKRKVELNAKVHEEAKNCAIVKNQVNKNQTL